MDGFLTYLRVSAVGTGGAHLVLMFLGERGPHTENQLHVTFCCRKLSVLAFHRFYLRRPVVFVLCPRGLFSKSPALLRKYEGKVTLHTLP